MVGTRTSLRAVLGTARSSATVRTICTLRFRSEAVERIVGKASGFHVGHIFANGALDTIAAFHEVAHEPQWLTTGQSQHIVEHQNLAAATDPGADPDARYRPRLRHIARHGG